VYFVFYVFLEGLVVRLPREREREREKEREKERKREKTMIILIYELPSLETLS
jgi:hypothetical protein